MSTRPSLISPDRQCGCQSPDRIQPCSDRPDRPWAGPRSGYGYTPGGTGLSATRGGFTSIEGAWVTPAYSNSLTFPGAGTAVAFICVRSSQVTRFTTNSPVSCAFFMESFNPPVGVCGCSGEHDLRRGIGHRVEKRVRGQVDRTLRVYRRNPSYRSRHNDGVKGIATQAVVFGRPVEHA